MYSLNFPFGFLTRRFPRNFVGVKLTFCKFKFCVDDDVNTNRTLREDCDCRQRSLRFQLCISQFNTSKSFQYRSCTYQYLDSLTIFQNPLKQTNRSKGVKYEELTQRNVDELFRFADGMRKWWMLWIRDQI
jgi:hypothetical protein